MWVGKDVFNLFSLLNFVLHVRKNRCSSQSIVPHSNRGYPNYCGEMTALSSRRRKQRNLRYAAFTLSFSTA